MERSEKVVVGDPSSPVCGEDFQPKKDVIFPPEDLDWRLSGDVEGEDSEESSVNERGMRSIPSCCTVMAGG